MKFLKRLLLVAAIGCTQPLFAQNAGLLTVGGDVNKFYPVAFIDGSWNNNLFTTLTISRSSANQDSAWKGSLAAEFEYRIDNFGNGAYFITAKIHQGYAGRPVPPFIAGWKDASLHNASASILIWLKGGNTTYHYSANAIVNPKVYDGVANPLPYVETTGGTVNDYKTALEPYVNSNGFSSSEDAYFADVVTRKVKVTQSLNWPDYVFSSIYQLPTLQEVESYIHTNQHLPDVPSAEIIQTQGLDLGEINTTLMKKVEEQTLYLIQQDKKIAALQEQHDKEMAALKEQMALLQKELALIKKQ